MDWPLIFTLTNVIAAAGWLALMLLPRGRRVDDAVLFGAVVLLCAAYALIFVGLLGGLVDPVRDAGLAPPSALVDYSVAGLMDAFRSQGVMVLGWTHYLAFDLFAGLWIARDADARRVGRLARVPFLLATFLAGPIGLGAWLAGRRMFAGR